MKKGTTVKETKSLLTDLEQKYFELVWYARSSSQEDEIKQARRRVKAKYQKEVHELCSCTDNWVHGYNSGMLAGIRLIQTAMSEGLTEAMEEFPLLDT